MNAIMTSTPPAWATTSTRDESFVALGEVSIEHSRLSTVLVRQEPEAADDPGAPVLLSLGQFETARAGASTLHPPFIRLDDITPDSEPRLAATFSVAGARTLALALLELADAADSAAVDLPARTVSLGALREQLAGAR